MDQQTHRCSSWIKKNRNYFTASKTYVKIRTKTIVSYIFQCTKFLDCMIDFIISSTFPKSLLAGFRSIPSILENGSRIHLNSIAAAPVFGQNAKFECQTFHQLVNDETTNHVREFAYKETRSPYSHKNYGRIPIVHFLQPLLPLKKPVTLVLDFEQPNFGGLDWEDRQEHTNLPIPWMTIGCQDLKKHLWRTFSSDHFKIIQFHFQIVFQLYNKWNK